VVANTLSHTRKGEVWEKPDFFSASAILRLLWNQNSGGCGRVALSLERMIRAVIAKPQAEDSV